MKKLTIFILMTSLIITSVFALTACGSTKIDLTEYVSLNYTGPDGYATAEVEIDKDGLNELVDAEKLAEFSEKISKSSILGSLFGSDNTSSGLTSLIRFKITSENENLKNGDIVRITVESNYKDMRVYIEDIEEYLGLKFKSTELEYTVEGLEAPAPYDPFENLEVVFTGYNNEGGVSLNNSDSEGDSINYTCSEEKLLSNGDSIVITAELNTTEEEFLNNFGETFEKCEKEYTVHGLGEFIKSLSEISDDDKEKIDTTLREGFEKDFSSTWKSKAKMTSIELENIYFLKLKDGIDPRYEDDNKLIYLYKVTIETAKENYTYYWYGDYTDVTISDDGSLITDISKFHACRITHLIDNSDLYYCGYEDVDSFYNYEIDYHMDKYTSESAH